jgi:hypothetical protein
MLSYRDQVDLIIVEFDVSSVPNSYADRTKANEFFKVSTARNCCNFGCDKINFVKKKF